MKFLKYFSYLVLLISIPVLSIHFNVFEIKDKIYQKYPNLNLRKYLFKKEPVFNRINNDYNVKFLPNTELVKMNLEKKKLNLIQITIPVMQKKRILLITNTDPFL